MPRSVPIAAIAALLVVLAAAAVPGARAACSNRCLECKAKGVPSFANKGKCEECDALTDASLKQACFDCIESGVPSDPARCLKCTSTTEISTAGAIRCLECTRKGVPADNDVDKKQCQICGTIADASDRQKCFDCIERGVPAAADKGLCYHCAFANNKDQCFNCLTSGVPADKNTCVTKWHMNWVLRRIGDTAITAKCGDSIEFANNPRFHNVLRLPGLSACPPQSELVSATVIEPRNTTAEVTATLPSELISAANAAAGKIFYLCSIGYTTGSPGGNNGTGHCALSASANMQVTVTLRNC